VSRDKAGSPHLGDEGTDFRWDWWGENPVEIILVAFILILFFTLPRMGCGIDKTNAGTQTGGEAATSQQ
jgi:hypothetical protein